MSPTNSTIRAYRKLLRELYKSATLPRPARTRGFFSRFRQAVSNSKDSHVHLENAATFLRSDRIYKNLLERYSPLAELTEEERIRATAQRVGLNVPKEYKS